MTSQLNPYLIFNGNAREALEHYRTIFGGELEVMTFGDMGATGDGSDGGPPADGVMHAYLGTPQGYALMASDAPPGTTVEAGSALAIALSGDAVDLLGGFFAALAEGGEVEVPFETQMWGDTFGQCKDRFGVTWLVNAGSGDGPAGEGTSVG